MDSLVGARESYERAHKWLKRDFAVLTSTPAGLSSLPNHPSEFGGPAWRITAELVNGGKLGYDRIDELLDEVWPEDVQRGRVRVDNLWAGRHGAAAAVAGLDKAIKATADEYERAEHWCLCFATTIQKLPRSSTAPHTDAPPGPAGRVSVAPAVPEPASAASAPADSPPAGHQVLHRPRASRAE